MGTVRKSITFTNQQDKWIKLKVKNSDFTNDSEYIRNLVREDQAKNSKLLELKNAIDQGLESGKSNLKITDIINKVDHGEL